MSHFLRLFLLLIFYVGLLFPLGAQKAEDRLVPLPREKAWGEGKVRLSLQGWPAEVRASVALQHYATVLAATNPLLSPAATARLEFRPLSDAADEAYRLEVGEETITVWAATHSGRLRAMQTLVQLRDAEGFLPCVRIADAPHYAWRGVMLDVSRHFFPLPFLEKLIRAMAAYKLNRLHLHLTDAAGWRMAINAYPRLTQLGAWRTHARWSDWWAGERRYLEEGSAQAYGGYYTQDELRRFVAYAQDYGVVIVPEIEMPAHSEAALTAYPELSCTQQPYTAADYCAGNPATYRFLETVLREVMDVFPSPDLHIGGDEAAKDHWRTCARCRQKMQELGILSPSDSLPTAAHLDALQAHFMAHMGHFLAAHGRRMIGWDEVVDTALPPSATIMVWRGAEGARQATALGREIILSPASHTYLDYYQDAPPTQPEAIGGYVPFSRIAALRASDFVPDSLLHLVRGVQANLWTEHVATEEHAEQMLFPRLLALADVAWTGSNRWQHTATSPLSTDRGAVAMFRAQRPLLKALGVAAFDLEQEVGQRAAVAEGVAHKARGAKVSYQRPYAAAYAATGNTSLVDGLQGGWSYADGRWQGFLRDAAADADAPTLDLTLDLGTAQPLAELHIDFFQSVHAWVHFPTRLRALVSHDGQHFSPWVEAHYAPVQHPTTDVRSFRLQHPTTARYLRVQGWVEREGGWLFADEIVVR